MKWARHAVGQHGAVFDADIHFPRRRDADCVSTPTVVSEAGGRNDRRDWPHTWQRQRGVTCHIARETTSRRQLMRDAIVRHRRPEVLAISSTASR